MIRFLYISNLAIVDEIELEFEPGFNVLTGETGAGKSIIVGALGLLIGERASAALVRSGHDKAIVQATVEIPGDGETIIRREIFARGRSRTFVNDALAAATTLKSLGTRLVDLHGQHTHQALLDAGTHAEVVDAYGGALPLAARVREQFDNWRVAIRNLAQSQLGEEERAARSELAQFQLAEIDRTAPEPGEDKRLVAERSRLANAERLQSLCGEAYAALYERDDAILAALGSVWRQLDDLARLDPGGFDAYTSLRDLVEPPLDDLAMFLRSYVAGIEASPTRLAEVETRLAELERLKKKYGQTLEAVCTRRAELAAEVEMTAGGNTRQDELARQAASARDAYLSVARRLSTQRARHGRSLGQRLAREWTELAMPHGRVEVRVASALPEEQWTERGIDEVELLFSANPGEPLRPLVDVASGGELSRVMLGLKTLASTDAAGKTLVFDEVDVGIGGAAAERVGARLRDLGATLQILCVTHAPQIAAAATTHHRVSKEVRDGRTRTVVERLGASGREEELARLMTGAVSPAALASARELLASKEKTNTEADMAKEKGLPRG